MNHLRRSSVRVGTCRPRAIHDQRRRWCYRGCRDQMDDLRLPPVPDPLPASTPVIRTGCPRYSQHASAGEGLPSSRRHRLNVPRPLTLGSPSRLHFQDLHRFHGLHLPWPSP
jgi:hypothetical protein